jgi:hypothetical protein
VGRRCPGPAPDSPRHLTTLLEGVPDQGEANPPRGADTRKGYLRAAFTEAFRRYLPPEPSHDQGAAEFPSPARRAQLFTVKDDRSTPATLGRLLPGVEDSVTLQCPAPRWITISASGR